MAAHETACRAEHLDRPDEIQFLDRWHGQHHDAPRSWRRLAYGHGSSMPRPNGKWRRDDSAGDERPSCTPFPDIRHPTRAPTLDSHLRLQSAHAAHLFVSGRNTLPTCLMRLNAALTFRWLPAAILVFATPAQSLHAQGAVDPSVRLVRAMAEELRTTAHLPGLSVAIGEGDTILFAGGFGFADVERALPVTPMTQFRTASVGKVITATALGRLVQEGRLNLDTAVQAYVPGFPLKRWPITARELAGHLAGMPHYNAADRIEQRFYSSVNDALSVFAAESLLSEPGVRYAYSTHGFTLLSAVIEGASGQPFLEYMKASVFAPLYMNSTGPHIIANPAPALATLYAVSGGVVSKIGNPEDPSYKWAGGGLISTPTDLLHLAAAYSNGFLTPATVRMMFTSQRLRSGSETGVGIAWRNSVDIGGHRVMEHAGSMEGTRTVVVMYPESRIAVAIMANAEWNSLIEETAHMLALPFLVKRSPVKQPSGAADVTVTVRKANGTQDVKSGAFLVAAGRGSLTVDRGTPTQVTYPLLYLERGNSYALVSPDGIAYMTLRVEADTVDGKAIAYGSLRATSPANDAPFLSFRGPFVATRSATGPRQSAAPRK